MSENLVVAGRGELADALAAALTDLAPGTVQRAALAGAVDRLDASEPAGSSLVVVPGPTASSRAHPDAAAVAALLASAAELGVSRVVMVSSTQVYEASTHHPGLVDEHRPAPPRSLDAAAVAWRELEASAQAAVAAWPGLRLTVLRTPPVPLVHGRDGWSRRLHRRVALTVLGHDPPVQLLALEDLAAAVQCALDAGRSGCYNLAPAAPLHQSKTLRGAGVRRLPLPYTVRAAARTLLAPLGLAGGRAELDRLRYLGTVSDAAARRELGFSPRSTTAEVAAAAAGHDSVAPGAAGDPFGFDPVYLERCCRYPLRFFERVWFRLEVDGLEHVPAEGPGVVAGLHRGFVPFDAIMMLRLLWVRRRRHVRFLVHPGLLKPPFIADFIQKVGGMVACQENARWVLERGGLVGILPEGVRGAFALHREGYRVGRFYRDEFVRIALRHRAPILPFVTIGSAEVFPILALLEWRWWRRWAEWPGIPITPTFPWLPLPLPAKFHTRILEPVPTDRLPPEAADDPAVVAELSALVRSRLQEAADDLVRRRRSIFRGSLFRAPGPILEGDPLERSESCD